MPKNFELCCNRPIALLGPERASFLNGGYTIVDELMVAYYRLPTNEGTFHNFPKLRTVELFFVRQNAILQMSTNSVTFPNETWRARTSSTHGI